ncbi:hypothetical protein OIO90_005862 [Microbotryomycetes sp. JL221]|nr:hypothetical protein OIO90_005862 [Microbotryomycetes sp. JL221]
MASDIVLNGALDYIYTGNPDSEGLAIVVEALPERENTGLELTKFGDGHRTTFTLPSPPFKIDTLAIIVRYMYTGILEGLAGQLTLTQLFSIWRGATYLSMDELVKLADMTILDRLDSKTSGQILAFALADDVGSRQLEQAASTIATSNFAEVWVSESIGRLTFDAQKRLVVRRIRLPKPSTLLCWGENESAASVSA